MHLPMCWCCVVEWRRLEVECCSVVVQAESSLEWMGLVPGLEGVEGADRMSGAGLRVVE